MQCRGYRRMANFWDWSAQARTSLNASKSEHALVESEERFRIMANSCPIGIWVIDAQGGDVIHQPGIRQFSGITTDEVEPGRWKTQIHPDDAPEFVGAVERALKDHTPLRAERRHRRVDGEWRWMESYAEPRFSPGGEFLGLVGTNKDITDRKQADKPWSRVKNASASWPIVARLGFG